jgi:hypothetical protein
MVLLLMVTACGFIVPGVPPDAAPDAAPDAQQCFGSFVMVCFNRVADIPTGAKNLPTGADIDTDSPEVCDQQNNRKEDLCVLAGKGFVLPAGQMLRAHGSKPLVLLSLETMTLEAMSTVDVRSTRMAAPQDRGAGANPPSCVNGMPPMMAGGGYGGSFGGQGGTGEQFSGAPPNSGKAAPAVSPAPTMLLGGCPGGDGDSTGGAGGGGGGAVALIAATSIQLLGTVNASGAGGRGGPASKSGGGGGGSGGMIVIDSPSITAMGPLFANGGGGGQGGTGGGAPVAGVDGGESNAPGTPAMGGPTGAEGGAGGMGSFGPIKPNGFGAVGGASAIGGGGGGGGGAGFIRGHRLPVAANIFPNAIDLP